MATTSLWHIEGRLKDLIAYVENPEKTVVNNSNLQPLFDVLSYVSRPAIIDTGRQTKDLCRIPKDVDFTEKDGYTEYGIMLAAICCIRLSERRKF